MNHKTLNHRIRVVYRKDGFVMIDVSPDVEAVLDGTLPKLNPNSTDPRREQIVAITAALEAAGMEVGRMFECCGEEEREVLFLGIRHKRPAGNSYTITNDEDHQTHKRILAEGQRRLSDEEDSFRWHLGTKWRANLPELLSSDRYKK